MMAAVENYEVVRDEWVGRIEALVAQVEQWARELGWATRRISKSMDDLGPRYDAPALLLQHELTQIALEPIARHIDGADGVADLYLMPAYNDIASLYADGARWRMKFRFPGAIAGAAVPSGRPRLLTKDLLAATVEAMRTHGR